MGNYAAFLHGFTDNEINVLSITHKEPQKSTTFCAQVCLEFFTIFFHSSTLFARCEKLEHSRLIKMSEMLKKYKSGDGIFIWKRFSWTKIEASIVKCWVMQNGWGLYFTPAGGTFYKQRMSGKLGHEPRVQRQFWDSLSGSLCKSPHELVPWAGTLAVWAWESG